MISAFLRNIVFRILLALQNLNLMSDQAWLQAMLSEMDMIESHSEALVFGLGCIRATAFTYLKRQRFEPLLRCSLIGFIFAWAAAKAYFIFALLTKSNRLDVLPIWIIGTLGLAGLAYGLSALSLCARRYAVFGMFLLSALAINSLFFGFAQFQFIQAGADRPESLTWYLAVVSEEYLMWIAILLAGSLGFILKNYDGVRLALRSS